MLKPLQDFVLIEVDKPNEQKGKLFVVEEWKSLPPTGTVIATGPEVESLSVGDRVQFERYSSIILEGDFRMVKERSIYGILDETA